MLRFPYRALQNYKAVNNRQTLCTFMDKATGLVFDKTLAVSTSQIERWMYGEDIRVAMPNISRDLQLLFSYGEVDQELRKINSEEFSKQLIEG